jgi:maltose O-acetyltransferase
MNEEEKILSGKLYTPGDSELVAMKLKAHNLSVDYNILHEDETEKRNEILRALFPDMGEKNFFQGPIYIHYGRHTHIGSGCFFNFNTTIQDDGSVTIGDNNNFGPGLTIVTPVHPMIAQERKARELLNGMRKGFCYAKPVTIGNNCWFGANVTVCPGVSIGDDCVIGAGSVVTKDIPSGTFSAGVPCKVIREITEADSLRGDVDLLGEYADIF